MAHTHKTIDRVYLFAAALSALLASFSAFGGIYRNMTPIKSNPNTWTPNSQTGCVYAYEYFRAGTVSTDGSSNVTSVTNGCSGGSAIAAASNGAVATPYATTSGPNSTAVANFNGGTMLPAGSATTNLFATGTAFTACQVMKINTMHTQNIFFEARDKAGSHDRAYFYYVNSATRYGFGGNFAGFSGARMNGITENTTNFHRVCLIYNGSGYNTNSNFSVYRDGSTTTGSVNDTQNGSTASVFGNYTNGTDNNFKADSYVSAWYWWDSAMDSTALSSWSTYITNNLGSF